MARKLKVYQTSQGFYDLAVAAPSMKAALEAWGAGSNLFHQGFAKESDDDKAIAAAREKPGVVLQRPVGSDAAFQEHSGLPTAVSLDLTREAKGSPSKAAAGKAAKAGKPTRAGEKAERRAAAAFERERGRREKQRQKEEAEAAKACAKRMAARKAAEAALEKATREHDQNAAQIEKDLAAVQRRAEAEEERWEKLKDRLEDAVSRAGS
jgi:hypothetical protein